MLFDPDLSDPPLLIYLFQVLVYRCQFTQRFYIYIFGRVHVISTEPISTVQTEVRGPASS
ncbi:unnamed protein product [Staurois parvus]|uniref:Uncharacterized protein n=1 Tax=Staurois parvus TaxID=386267 RepID=A0ABN9FBL2_9NEOB|nr:unnamed protein product [Staurois parvus]